MQILPLIESWREGALVAGAVVAVFAFFWLVARLSRRPRPRLDQSETMRVAIIQIGRLAESVDRLTQSLENRARLEDKQASPPSEEKRPAMSLSMFGR